MPRLVLRWIAFFAALTAFAGIARLGAAEMAELPPVPENAEVAVFAGGCFWCVEKDFDHVPGVLATTSGYIGGTIDNPTYKQVTYTETGHFEAVRVLFDPQIVSYNQLLNIFWRSVDPTDDGGQFCDRGTSYRTGIFAQDEDQLKAAQSSKETLSATGILDKPIVTEVFLNTDFYPAEVYHQDFYQKSSRRYTYYRWACGRDNKIKSLWGQEAHQGIDYNS